MDTLARRIIVNGDMSGNVISDTVDLSNVLHYSVNAQWADGGALAGTLFIDISSDMGDPVNWENVSSAAVAGAGSQIWLDRNVPYRYARIRYVAAGGAGTINANFITKGDE